MHQCSSDIFQTYYIGYLLEFRSFLSVGDYISAQLKNVLAKKCFAHVVPQYVKVLKNIFVKWTNIWATDSTSANIKPKQPVSLLADVAL